MAGNIATLEANGIPTVAIVDCDFVQNYKTTARGVGLPEMPLAIAQAQYTGLSKDEVRHDIDQFLEQIIAELPTPIQAGTAPILEPISTQSGYQVPWGTVERGPVDEKVIKFRGKDYAEAYDTFQEEFLI